MKRLVLMVISVVLISTGMLYAQNSMNMIMEGYLADVECAMSPGGVSEDEVDLTISPEKHTAACLKMPKCEASGYGFYMKDSSGKYAFMTFDQKGHDLVKEYLKNVQKEDNIVVAVTGMMEGNIHKVEKIIEAAVGQELSGAKKKEKKMPGMKM